MRTINNIHYVNNAMDLDIVVERARGYKVIALDTETQGLDPHDDNIDILLIQIAFGGVAYVINAALDLDPLKEIIEDEKYLKVLQNAKFDYKMLFGKRGISISGIFDTMVAEHILHMGEIGVRNDLGSLVKRYLGIDMNKETVKAFINFSGIEFSDEQIMYAGEDVLVLEKIMDLQVKQLAKFDMLQIAELEFALIKSLSHMEYAGILIDDARWRVSLLNTQKNLFEANNRLHNWLPGPPPPPPKELKFKKDGSPYKSNDRPVKPDPILNLASTKQLVWACEQVGIDLESANDKTRKGLTNKDTLKFAMTFYKGGLANDPVKVDILKTIVSWRGYEQVNKTFGENLLSKIKSDGRIHATFKATGTDSGRFSSNDPNLQNIQKKGEEGRILRSCFVPQKGKKFVIADYSQIELRIAAELSGDPKMLSILNDPSGDLHTGTASEMYGIPLDKVTGAIRKAAKTLNFGIIYGMSVDTLADRLECSVDEANLHLIKYRETYHVLMAWIENQAESAVALGLTKTVGGRIRWIPSVPMSNPDRKRLISYYRRVGKNHPIQGTSADMTKAAMVLMFEKLWKLGAVVVNTIHDEFCVEVPEENTIEVAHIVRDKMIQAARKFIINVPVLVDVKIRDSWWKDDGVEDNECGQQLWLIPEEF